MTDNHDRQTGSDALNSTHTAVRSESQSREAPAEWGDLVVTGELGRGGGGRVYRAWDPALERDVALKIISAPTVEAGANLLREGQLLARVRHPNVVIVHGARQIGTEVGVWMELVNGRSLAEIVRQDGVMGADEAALIGVSLCRALAAVHGAGLIHRDVKAHNAMREAGGRILLVDFGLGREVADPERQAGPELSGTPDYMAPELFAGHQATTASDIYGLGVLLFFLVTRRYPVEGRSMEDIAIAHRQRQRRLLSDARPDLPDAFIRTVERALSLRPESRQATAGELMNELQQSTGAGGKSVSTHLWRMGGLVAAPLVLLLLGFLMCTAFDLSFERGPEFADFTVVDWLISAVRSLLMPVMFALTVVLVVAVVAIAGGIVRRTSAPARHWLDGARERATSRLRSAGLLDPGTLGNGVVLLHACALAALFWRYSAILSVLTNGVSHADAATLALLDRDGIDEATHYNQMLTLMLLGTGTAWYALLKQRRLGWSINKLTIAGGLALFVFTVLMLEVPWMVFFQPPRPIVEVATVRCYQTGAHDDEILVYCPGSSPAVRVVREGDPAVHKPGGVGNMFEARSR